jgi:hypothetical protein
LLLFYCEAPGLLPVTQCHRSVEREREREWGGERERERERKMERERKRERERVPIHGIDGTSRCLPYNYRANKET